MEAVAHEISTTPEVSVKGKSMYDLIVRLFPICRSITGAGVRQTLDIIQEHIPIVTCQIPTGEKIFDWEIPKEWNIRDAYIKNSKGDKIVDFVDSNLHVLNYSIPINRWVKREELQRHLYTSPAHPSWIPYRTSYYKEEWGFCVSHNQFLTMTDSAYEVCIDSTLTNGHLAWGELYIPGEISEEVLISTHICHPSLCNDNLSGISVAVFLAKQLMKKKSRYSYRFLFIPGTIGAIAWLATNKSKVRNIRHGLVAVLLGARGNFTYKRSRQATAEIDAVVEEVLKQNFKDSTVVDFSPYGYDERQFCSPGFNLPVGCITRIPYGQYPEYHTSADNLDFVKAEALDESLQMLLKVVEWLEANTRFINTKPMCEPNLGKRGLYSLLGNSQEGKDFQMAMLWVLNYSDGPNTLLDISKRSKIKFEVVCDAANRLREHNLLDQVTTQFKEHENFINS